MGGKNARSWSDPERSRTPRQDVADIHLAAERVSSPPMGGKEKHDIVKQEGAAVSTANGRLV